jgi:hypothetical protein
MGLHKRAGLSVTQCSWSPIIGLDCVGVSIEESSCASLSGAFVARSSSVIAADECIRARKEYVA